MQTIRDYIQDDLNVLDSACEMAGFYNPNIAEAFEEELIWELENRNVDVDKELNDNIKTILVEIIQIMVSEGRVSEIVGVPIYTNDIIDVWKANRAEIDLWYRGIMGNELIGYGLADTLNYAVAGWIESLAMVHAMNMLYTLEN